MYDILSFQCGNLLIELVEKDKTIHGNPITGKANKGQADIYKITIIWMLI